MCCSWTIVGSSSGGGGGGGGSSGDRRYQDMSYVTNAVLAEHMRQKIRRDLSRWSRKLLLCLGLENIGKHIVGDSKWEKLYDGCPSSSSTAEQDPEEASADFEPQVRDDDTTTPSSGKSPSALDSSTPTVQSVQVDVGGGEDVEDDEPVVEHADQATNGKVKEMCDGREDKDGAEEEEIDEQDEMECRRRDELEANDEIEKEEAIEKDDIVASASPPLHVRRLSKMEEGEAGVVGREEIENEEDEVEGDRDDLASGHNSPMSTSPSRQARVVGGLMDRPPESPNSGSEAAQSTEEKGPGGGGGALVDNLFQILPYWYFLNRAFGMPGGPDGGLGTPLGTSMVDGQGDGEEDDDDGGGSSTADGGGGQDSGRGSSPFGVGGSQSSSATQRLNSLLLLESLRQQLQNQGQQGLSSQEQTLQQQLQISELLTRMSGGGDVEGRNISSCLPTLQRGQPAVALENHQGNSVLRPASVEPHEIEDQPLDLTSCRTNREDEKVGSNYADFPAGGNNAALNHHISPFVLDEQTSKVFRSNPRSSKGYTAQELQAALHDIQSGKLGTRRAAVIYGIPRSTLRNKVYKLGKDRGKFFGTAAGTIANQNHNHLNNNNNNNNNNANNNNNNNNNSKDSIGNASLLGKLSYFHGLTAASSYLSGGGVNRGAPPSSRYNNMEEDDGEEAPPAPSTFLNRRAPPSLYAMGNGDVSPPKQLAAAHLHHPHQSSLSQLISKHAHQQRTTFHQNYQSSPMDVAMMEESSCHSDDHGPVAAPLLSHHKDSWKYALARHQEQQQQQLLSQQQRQTVGSANHFQRQPSHQQQQAQQNHGGGGGDDSSSGLDLGKKSRPKRGKYRNYDREALIKAVRAVQNGEMSVHRAGSFFGVPHSTLEYKVKERHLLRRPKRKEVTSPLSQTKSSSPESSSQDAATPNTAAARHSAFAKGPAATAKNLINNNNNNNNNSSGEGGGLHHPYMFPLTSDLRESLSRYLSQENNKGGCDDDRASSTEIMDTGATGQHDQDDDDEDEPSPPENHRLHHQLTQKSSSTGKGGGGGAAALALEGLIGNRLSNLFQLNDILLRSGSATGGGGGEGRPENLLDLSKK